MVELGSIRSSGGKAVMILLLAEDSEWEWSTILLLNDTCNYFHWADRRAAAEEIQVDALTQSSKWQQQSCTIHPEKKEFFVLQISNREARHEHGVAVKFSMERELGWNILDHDIVALD